MILFMLPFWMAAERNFRSDVHPLKMWVKRDKASLLALDKLGEKLLAQYQQPQQQGEIYYYLAHQHAQGGLVFPQKVIDYASRSLKHPVTPDQKMRLCVYRGDAFMVLSRKKPFAERRREAVDSYLQGLKDLKILQLPDTPPLVPNNPPNFIMRGYSTKQEADEASQKFEEERQKYIKAREHAEFICTMMKHRDVLQGQIASLYGRRPIATEELKDTATKFLGEGKELDRLMAAVEEKIAKLPAEPKQNRTPVEAATPPPSSKHPYLIVLIGAGAFISAILVLVSRWRRTRRESGPTWTQ